MQVERIYTNANVVLADEVIRGTVVVKDGVFKEVSEGISSLPNAQDLDGSYLMPGFVELHTDNLERFMNPRPGVEWPSASSAFA